MRNLCRGMALAVIMMGLATVAAAHCTTLRWNAPTTNADGSTLTDLKGYTAYYGTASGVYSEALDVGLATSAVIQGLMAGETYYFAVTARDHSGNESVYSNEVIKTIPVADPGDVTPPDVAIVSPADGSTVPRKSTVNIVADASDVGGVAEVTITVQNGVGVVEVCTDQIPPYTCAWLVPAGNRKAYRIYASATDQTGNVGESASIEVMSR